MSRNDPSKAAIFLKERLDRIDPEVREKEIVSTYTALRVYESDCDKAQGTLRTIASAWVLAAVGGIGLIFQNEYSGQGRFDAFVAAPLRQAFLLFASMGLISLWYVDQRIYQRLLHGSFAVGCWMEEQFQTILPPIRLYMFQLNLDITRYLGWFYRAPILLLTAFAIFNFIAVLAGSGPHFVSSSGKAPSIDPGISYLIAGVVCVLQVTMVAIVLVVEGAWPNLRAELPPSLDKSLTPASPSGSRSGP